MRILIVGANGTVGRAATMALQDRHEIIKVGRTSGERLMRSQTQAASLS